MAKRRSTIRQTDLKRALRAATAAGLAVSRVELDPATGKIIITTSAEMGTGTQTSNPLDHWLATHARTP
jgi:hypothetical protein